MLLGFLTKKLLSSGRDLGKLHDIVSALYGINLAPSFNTHLAHGLCSGGRVFAITVD